MPPLKPEELTIRFIDCTIYLKIIIRVFLANLTTKPSIYKKDSINGSSWKNSINKPLKPLIFFLSLIL